LVDASDRRNCCLGSRGLPKGSATERRKRATHFEGAHFVFETGDIRILRDGRVQVTVVVPHDSVDGALKLRTSYGILLEARVAAVKRKAP
jgi:hypothetical protein